MRIILIGLAVFALTGCQPIGSAMVVRLDPDQQREIDSVWQNMLTPARRLDRQTLLDCVVILQLYERGVDKFTAHSEKQTSAGRVEMNIEFDRKRPQADQFCVRLTGPWGRVIREEKWSAKEIYYAYGLDEHGMYHNVPNEHSRDQELARRFERFGAATQPATR